MLALIVAIGAIATLAITVVRNSQPTTTLQEHEHPLVANKSDTRLYTVAFVKHAINYYEAHGKDKTLTDYRNLNNTEEWQLFILDANGMPILGTLEDTVIQEVISKADSNPTGAWLTNKKQIWFMPYKGLIFFGAHQSTLPTATPTEVPTE